MEIERPRGNCHAVLFIARFSAKSAFIRQNIIVILLRLDVNMWQEVLMEKIMAQELKPRRVFGGTEIFVGCGISEAIPPTMARIIEGGSVALLYREDSDFVERISRELRNCGYKIFSTDSSDKIPEYVRFIFAVGGGDEAEDARLGAKRLGIEWGISLTVPSSDTILRGAPKQVYLDRDILSNCSREHLAAGWGLVYSQSFRRFEEYVKEKIMTASNACVERDELNPDADAVELALYLLESSVVERGEDNADVMARIMSDSDRMRGRKVRLHGEYKFVCAAVLNTFYSQYLSSPCLDCLPPPCHGDLLDEISALTGRTFETLVKVFDFFDTNSYFRISYILSEYRMDLLEKLKGIDFHTAQKRWRRMYNDAGYWLKSAMNAAEVLRALKLAAEIGDGLLRYIAETGFTALCA